LQSNRHMGRDLFARGVQSVAEHNYWGEPQPTPRSNFPEPRVLFCIEIVAAPCEPYEHRAVSNGRPARICDRVENNQGTIRTL